MNLAYRSKFKSIKNIETLGSSLKGDELLITLRNGVQIKTFGNVNCFVVNRLGEEEEIKAKYLTKDLDIKLDQFVDQL
jgi:hypothetical protein